VPHLMAGDDSLGSTKRHRAEGAPAVAVAEAAARAGAAAGAAPDAALASSRHFNTREKPPLLPGYLRKSQKRMSPACEDGAAFKKVSLLFSKRNRWRLGAPVTDSAPRAVPSTPSSLPTTTTHVFTQILSSHRAAR
jgi:hypothetical protein